MHRTKTPVATPLKPRSPRLFDPTTTPYFPSTPTEPLRATVATDFGCPPRPAASRQRRPFTPKKKPKKEVDYFWKHQTSNSRLRHSIGHSIPFRKNVLLRITYFRIPDVPGLHFVPWHRGSGCLGAAWGYPQPPEANVKDNGFPWPPCWNFFSFPPKPPGTGIHTILGVQDR